MTTKTRKFDGKVYTYVMTTASGMTYWHNVETGNLWVTSSK